MDRSRQIMEWEKDGALAHEQSLRIRKGMGHIYARKRAREKGDNR